MELSGIAIEKYSTHFTRSAASTKAKPMEKSLKNIKCAGQKSKNTFLLHYEKQTEEQLDIRFQQVYIVMDILS